MVLDEKHAVKPERLGFADIVDVIGVDPAVVSLLAHLRARAAEQPEPHSPCLSSYSAAIINGGALR